MQIEFTPRISGGFVHHVMRDMNVSNQMLELGITEKTGHDLIKSIIIRAFTDFRIDINEVINNIRDDQSIDKALPESANAG